MARALGIGLAVLAHVAILLFGGLLFLRDSNGPAQKKVEIVDLVAPSEDKKKEDQPKQEQPAEEAEEQLQESDPMPDLQQIAALDAAAAAPKLEALSLSALSDLLDNNASSGATGFATGGGDLASGGRIGGTGAAIAADLDSVFSIADIDQRPRAIVQGSPVYPQELRRKKVEGTVSVLLVVNQAGLVVDPRIETSSDPGFERPALDAVRRWKFEPATRGGKKVQCKIRVPIRFSVT
jgi:periplasmic protein TonB